MVEEVIDLGGEGGGENSVKSGRGAPMRWTNVMSSFVLTRMCDLIQSGVRNEKGFKEVHLNYIKMETIFGNGLATGKFAMGSNEPLGNPSELGDGFMKDEPFEVENIVDDEVQEVENTPQMAKNKKPISKDRASASSVSKKRKRSMINEEDNLALSSITEAVKDVGAAIRETVVLEVHPELYGAVMNMAGYPDNVLMLAFSYLVDNKAQSSAFVAMSDIHRRLWLDTFRARHNI